MGNIHKHGIRDRLSIQAELSTYESIGSCFHRRRRISQALRCLLSALNRVISRNCIHPYYVVTIKNRKVNLKSAVLIISYRSVFPAIQSHFKYLTIFDSSCNPTRIPSVYYPYRQHFTIVKLSHQCVPQIPVSYFEVKAKVNSSCCP